MDQPTELIAVNDFTITTELVTMHLLIQLSLVTGIDVHKYLSSYNKKYEDEETHEEIINDELQVISQNYKIKTQMYDL